MVGERVQIILTNNFVYSGEIISQDDFFIFILDKYGKKISIGKKDIQVIKEVENGRRK